MGVDWITIMAQALIHSLWQMTLLGACLWGSLTLIPSRKSATRHALSLSCLYAVPAIFIGTCWYLYQNAQGPFISLDYDVSQNHLYGILVMLWGVGALLPLHRFLQNRRGVRVLIHHRYEPASPELFRRFQAMKRRLGLNRAIQFGLSDQVSGPCTLSFWKPLILLPPLCLTRLSLDELEAIIAHELAHIKRHDALHRVFQSLLDIVFYYHPVVRFISRQVSVEREHACDDLAVRFLKDPKPLATGLLKAGLLNAENTLLLSAQSQGYQALEARIGRLINMPALPHVISYKKRNSLRSAKLILGAFIVAAGLMALQPDFSKAHETGPLKSQLISLKDDVCDQITVDNLYGNSKYYRGGHAKITVEDGIVYMNAARLPEDTQSSLKTIFTAYGLEDHSRLMLRYYGSDIKLLLYPIEGQADKSPTVFKLESAEQHVRTFRLPSKPSEKA